MSPDPYSECQLGFKKSESEKSSISKSEREICPIILAICERLHDPYSECQLGFQKSESERGNGFISKSESEVFPIILATCVR